MAAVTKGWSLFLPLRYHVRHRGKINIQRPDPGPWERRILLEITKPILLNDMAKDSARCEETQQKLEDKSTKVNLYEEFLVEQCKRMFAEMRMILAFQILPTTNEELRHVRNKLYKKGMDVIHFNNQVMRKAVTDTKYQNMAVLFNGTSRYVVAREPNLSDAVKVARRAPGFILLGGLVDNALLSRDSVILRSKLPDVETLRGELVSTLGATASLISSHLVSQQTRLSASLHQYTEQGSDR